ncbi:hypothetical protein IL306_009261 [Fusarium sp. DS 682]|nr:hypothetical protein IL306_009261 [Fusarium sp. DS 682]
MQCHDNEKEWKGKDSYTRPPRVSFGFELEFLVATEPREVEADDTIPGIAPIANSYDGQEAVLKLLRDHGFCAEKDYADGSSTKYPWTVTMDGSVEEAGTAWADPTYNWQSAEIASPPFYACDTVYRLVSVLVRLLTNNLRVRVNTSCGFHVHVGNGPHQMDMHALRNYAALQWASEPVLSTLHCPSRSFAHYSRSIRRFTGTELTGGVTADLARSAVTSGVNFIPRYLSRARRLGEDPVASKVKLYRRIREVEVDGWQTGWSYVDPDIESDDSDYECQHNKPFYRPRKTKGAQRQVGYMPDKRIIDDRLEAEAARLDSESIRRDLPPQLDFPSSQSTASCQLSGSVPLLDEKRKKAKPVSRQAIPSNRYNLAAEGTNREAVSKIAWRGVAELMACDVGAHQIAHLMCDHNTLQKYYSYNWKGQLGEEMQPKIPKDTHGTVESRLAGGSLDAEWIVTWIKIQCRMLEWARDAEPSQLMRVLGNLSRDDVSDECTYDVLDFLRDLGLYTELKHCQERLLRAGEAWFECMMLDSRLSSDSSTTSDSLMPDFRPTAGSSWVAPNEHKNVEWPTDERSLARLGIANDWSDRENNQKLRDQVTDSDLIDRESDTCDTY